MPSQPLSPPKPSRHTKGVLRAGAAGLQTKQPASDGVHFRGDQAGCCQEWESAGARSTLIGAPIAAGPVLSKHLAWRAHVTLWVGFSMLSMPRSAGNQATHRTEWVRHCRPDSDPGACLSLSRLNGCVLRSLLTLSGSPAPPAGAASSTRAPFLTLPRCTLHELAAHPGAC
jgi:hypothetical protein